MTDTPDEAPQAQRTVELDPVAGHYKRLAEHHANEALMLAAQLREAVTLLKRAQAEAADSLETGKPEDKKDTK